MSSGLLKVMSMFKGVGCKLYTHLWSAERQDSPRACGVGDIRLEPSLEITVWSHDYEAVSWGSKPDSLSLELLFHFSVKTILGTLSRKEFNIRITTPLEGLREWAVSK